MNANDDVVVKRGRWRVDENGEVVETEAPEERKDEALPGKLYTGLYL